jgi:hypothetical protein
MQIWRLVYGVSVDDLKKQYTIDEIKEQFTEQRKMGIGSFFTSSVIASPSGQPAELAIWAEWEDKDEIWGHCMKGIILGVHDGFEDIDLERSLSQQMSDLFTANVKSLGRIRWLKEEFQEAIPEVKGLLSEVVI